ncbi:hypothetical protein L5D93_06540 [Paenibacillus thiaminolyticus]|nr:hypothetical protein [Paenibacillus thiaminolyticus]
MRLSSYRPCRLGGLWRANEAEQAEGRRIRRILRQPSIWRYTAKVIITIPYPSGSERFRGYRRGRVSENMNVKEVGEEQALITRQMVRR